MVRRVGIFRLLPLVFCLAVAGVAHAVERAPSQAVAEVGGASGDALRDREKAARIAELIQGALPADINPSSLLAISAADPDGENAAYGSQAEWRECGDPMFPSLAAAEAAAAAE